jgi:hypothetical protein
MTARDTLHQRYPGSALHAPVERELAAAVDEFLSMWAQLAEGSPGHRDFDLALEDLVSLAYELGREVERERR